MVESLSFKLKKKSMIEQKKNRKGFSLVEVGIVTAILIIIASIGVPAINNFVTENRAPKVAEELQRFVARTKAASESGMANPYTGIGTVNLARSIKSSSVVKVVGDDTIEHRLGGGSQGVITLAPAEGGRAFAITLVRVNEIVCPTLATIMNSSIDTITINGTTAKETNMTSAEVTTPYNPSVAQNACESDNENTFVFTVR